MEQYYLPTPVRYYARSIRLALVWLLFGLASSVQADWHSTLKLGGAPGSVAYTELLLSHALEARGHKVVFKKIAGPGHLPMTRLEAMLEQGDISVLILGQTAERDRRFLKVPVGMTDNLVTQRILFIQKGSQSEYDPVHSLEDFRQLGKIAAIGESWADRVIWEANGLELNTISGDWRRFYRMVAATTREVDYLPRGAHEMSEEWHLHPELDVERNLVFIYEQDHVLYVSPTQPKLHLSLHKALQAAHDSGLIRRLAREYYAQVFEPPVSLQKRRPILLRPATW